MLSVTLIFIVLVLLITTLLFETLISIKSVYHLAVLLKEQSKASSSDDPTNYWRVVWNLHLPNKLKIFVWRCLSSILPTMTNLCSRGMQVDPRCYLCKKSEESIVHFFGGVRFWLIFGSKFPFLMRVYYFLARTLGLFWITSSGAEIV